MKTFWIQQQAKDNKQAETKTVLAETPQEALKNHFGANVQNCGVNAVSGEYITQEQGSNQYQYWFEK